jgi:hypothetical protein
MEMTGPPPQGDYSKGPAMIIFDVVTVSVATIVVAIRFAVRIWISKCLGWDDWTILAAAVRRSVSYFSHCLQSAVGELHRWRLGSSGDSLWFRAVYVLPQPTSAPRIREIRVWRVDPDLCDPDVHQSVDLPILAAHTGYQSPDPPSTSRCRLLGGLERRPHSYVDLPVHSGGRSLE